MSTKRCATSHALHFPFERKWAIDCCHTMCPQMHSTVQVAGHPFWCFLVGCFSTTVSVAIPWAGLICTCNSAGASSAMQVHRLELTAHLAMVNTT